MEFACGFVYVPPALSRMDCQRPHATKRSALLPPAHRIRPSNPPPTPPVASGVARAPKSSSSFQQRIQEFEQSRLLKKSEPLCENVDFQNKKLNPASHQASPPQRTALLPPHMRPAASSQRLPSNPPRTELPVQPQPPAVPPWPLNRSHSPEYLTLLPSLPTSQPTAAKDKDSLPGNPNVVVVSLGDLLSEEQAEPVEGKPNSCSQCGSVLSSFYANVATVCCFCQSSMLAGPPGAPDAPLGAYRDGLFLLNPEEKLLRADDALLIFCIDISGSMSLMSELSVGELVIHKSRLQCVREAVLQCLKTLGQKQPDIRVGLITFNYQVTVHGYSPLTSCYLRGAELTDKEYLKKAADALPSPPPLSQTKELLKKQVTGLQETGPTALGPAALLSIAMAARHPGSKVIICTDGKANTDLGNLEVEDNDARTLLSSTIFYQELGEYAANQGVTVSVLSLEGTDCRLDELGSLADRTGGTVVIASPTRLQPEFEQMIENRTIATHCTVTLLLPKSLRVRGEREAGSRGTREVGNVWPDKEITFQFGAGAPTAGVPAPASGSSVCIQLQIRYRRRNGQKMLRVITTDREVTDDSAAVLSSLSVAIVQLNSSQASATLAVRGRFSEARKEAEQQRKLIERAIEHNQNTEDKKTHNQWVKTMEPIYNNIQNYTRRNCVISDTEPLTDAGAALLYNMKHFNRKSITTKKTRQPAKLPASTFYIAGSRLAR